MEDQSYTSIIDHFFWTERTASNIENVDVLHLRGNTSDHRPIYCSLKINISPSSRTPPIINRYKPLWKSAVTTTNEEKNTIEEKNTNEGNIFFFICGLFFICVFSSFVVVTRAACYEKVAPIKKCKPPWKRATDIQKDSYKTTLEQHLGNLKFYSVARHCKNVHCQSENHLN